MSRLGHAAEEDGRGEQIKWPRPEWQRGHLLRRVYGSNFPLMKFVTFTLPFGSKTVTFWLVG
jgi:hypothetical protein